MLSCGGGLLTAAALYMEVAWMQFMKMHGLGNDYIYLNCLEGLPEDAYLTEFVPVITDTDEDEEVVLPGDDMMMGDI